MMKTTLSPTLKKIGALAAAVGLTLGAATQPASAADGDTQTFLLTSDHCTGGCGPQTGGFGQVLVTDSAGGALTFDVTLFNGNQFVSSGLDLTFAFDLVGSPTITYSGLTSGFTIPGGIGPQQTAGTYHMNGFGDFEYGVEWGGQNGGPPNSFNGALHFVITSNGGALSLSSLETNGVGGPFFVADIYSATTFNTGAVDASAGGPPTSVPEPETYAMLLAGLGMMGFVARRRKQRAL